LDALVHCTVAALLIGAHVEHTSTLELNEYKPASHKVHEIAPVDVPVLVIELAPQFEHAATFDTMEYVPTPQAVHKVAPGDVPVFVMEPAWH
jgi:hypothetical protein